MTDEMNRPPVDPLLDGDDLFAPSPEPEEKTPAQPDEPPEETVGSEPEVVAVSDEPKPEPTEPEGDEPVFNWDERDPLDEDELFGQIGLPEGGQAPDVSDLFDNDGPDAELPEEELPASPEVAPAPAEEAPDEDEVPPVPEKKKVELNDKEIDVRRKYAIQRIGAARVRFCFAVLFSLMLVVLECFQAFGFNVTEPLGISRVPGGAALLDLQLILLVAFCSWRTLYAGVRAVFEKRFRAESLLVLALIAVVWFDLDAFFRGGGGATYAALPLAIVLTASTWFEFLEWETRCRTLDLIRNRGVKYAAIDRDDGDGDRLSLSRVRYIDSYDGEIKSYREDSGFQAILAFLSVGVAVGAFLSVTLSSDAGIAPAFSVAISVLLVSCPFASLISRRIWFNELSSSFLDGGTAVIGEDAAFRYAHVTTFSVEDGDAFSYEETRIRIVNVFRDSRLDEILQQLSAIYRKLGGPLSHVLSEATSGAVAGDAEITEILPSGVTAKIGGRTVLVGSGEYVAQNGYSLPEVEVDKVLKNDRMCVLFVAYEGEVRARFYIEYVLSRAFETRAEKLRKLGVTTEIRTFDPCLSSAYFSRISYLPDEAVVIRRMGLSDLEKEEVRRAESGLFALGSLSTMLDALHAFRRYTRARAWLGFCKLGQFLLGAALAAYFLIRYPHTPIPAWLSALYSLVLILLSVLHATSAGKKIAEGMRNARKPERK